MVCRHCSGSKIRGTKNCLCPVIFQVVRAMRDLGMLEQLNKAGKEGVDAQTILNGDHHA